MQNLYLILFSLLMLYFFMSNKEHLRIQGSHDIRGDIPIPRTYVGPWNIGSSSPKRRRSILME